MKQYDVYENIDEDTRESSLYFVDVQTELLNDLDSRVVIPIVPVQATKGYPKNLCSVIEIRNGRFCAAYPSNYYSA